MSDDSGGGNASDLVPEDFGEPERSVWTGDDAAGSAGDSRYVEFRHLTGDGDATNLVRTRFCEPEGIVWSLALLGRKEEAIRAARRGVGLMPRSKDAFYGLVPIQYLAFVCTLVGRQDEAIEQLGVLLSSSGYTTPHVLRLDPRWDPLRNNPKFEALLAKYEVRS